MTRVEEANMHVMNNIPVPWFESQSFMAVFLAQKLKRCAEMLFPILYSTFSNSCLTQVFWIGKCECHHMLSPPGIRSQHSVGSCLVYFVQLLGVLVRSSNCREEQESCKASILNQSLNQELPESGSPVKMNKARTGSQNGFSGWITPKTAFLFRNSKIDPTAAIATTPDNGKSTKNGNSSFPEASAFCSSLIFSLLTHTGSSSSDTYTTHTLISNHKNECLSWTGPAVLVEKDPVLQFQLWVGIALFSVSWVCRDLEIWFLKIFYGFWRHDMQQELREGRSEAWFKILSYSCSLVGSAVFVTWLCAISLCSPFRISTEVNSANCSKSLFFRIGDGGEMLLGMRGSCMLWVHVMCKARC